AYSTPGVSGLTVRGQSPDIPQPLPIGPSGDSAAPPLAKSQVSDHAIPEQLGPPRTMPSVSNKPDVHAVPSGGDCCCPTDCDPCCPPCCDPCCGWRSWFPFFRSGACLAEPPHCLWVSADYLLWEVKPSRLPALVTTSPPGTPRPVAGVLGVPGSGTTVLF